MTEPVVSIAIDPAMKAELDRQAALEDSSASSIAEKAIAAYLQAESVKRAALTEAVREADEGVFVSREAVDRWVDSWGDDAELPVPRPDVFSARG